MYYYSLPFLFATPRFQLDRVSEISIKLIIALISVQQSNVLLFLRSMFFRLNSEISNLNRSKIIITQKNNFFNRANAKINCLDLIHEQTDLKSLIVLYNKLLDSCKMLNSVFGGSASACASHTLIQLVITLYYVVIGTVFVNLPMSILWIFALMLQQWFVLFSCELLVKEVK